MASTWKYAFIAFLLVSITLADSHLLPGQLTKTAVSMVKVPVDTADQHSVDFYIFVFEGAETDLRTLPDYQQHVQEQAEQFRTTYDQPNAYQDLLQESVDRVRAAYGNNPEVVSLQNAEVTVYFYDVTGRQNPVPGCETLQTNTPYIDPDGNTAGYYAVCHLPQGNAPGGYSGACTRYIAVYNGQAARNRASSFTEEVCDRQLIGLPAFTRQLGEVLNSPANSAALFGAFVLLGLLLATMYFSGRSPLTLLDIATPRLPSPKTIIPGGQILGPFGYTELKRSIKRLQGTDKNLMETEFKIRGAAMAGSVYAINRIANSIRHDKADKWADDVDLHKSTIRSLGLLAAEYNISLSRLDFLRNSQMSDFHTNKEFQEKIGRLLADIQSRAKEKARVNPAGAQRDEILLLSLTRSLQSMASMRVLEVLTGHRKIDAKRSGAHQWMQYAIGKAFGQGPYRQFGLIHPLVAGSYDSLMRAFWQFGRFGKALGRETKRRTLEVGYAARRSAARRGWVQMAQEKPYVPTQAKDMVMGHMVPTIERQGAFYRDLYKEAYADMNRYLLRQLLARYSVHIRMSEEEMLEMGHKHKDVVAMSNLRDAMRNPEFRQLEAEMRRILSNTRLSEHDKLSQLFNLAELHNARIDPKLLATMERLQQIEAMGHDNTHGHEKFMAFYSYLVEEHGIHDPTYWSKHSLSLGLHPGDTFRPFHFFMGHDTLPGNVAWEHTVLRNLIYHTDLGKTNFTLEHALEDSYANMVNRLSTLRPSLHTPEAAAAAGEHDGSLGKARAMMGLNEMFPDHIVRGPASTAEFDKIERQLAKGFVHSLTAEGRKVFHELTGRTLSTDIDVDRARINSMSRAEFEKFYKALMESTLYSYRWMEKTHEIGKGAYGPLLGGVEKKTGAPHWWESTHEFGPDKSWHVGDMKRHWVITPGDDFALNEYAQKRYEKSYIQHYKASIARELAEMERNGATVKEMQGRAKQVFIRDLLRHDTEDYRNSLYGHNTYGTTNQYARSLLFDNAAVLHSVLKEQGADPRTIRRFAQFDPTRDADAVRDLAHHVQVHDERFREYLKRPVFYDTIAKSDMPWVMKHEGGFIPWHPGVQVSDRDRVYGYFAIHDGKEKGQWRRWDPDTQKIDFKDAQHLTDQYQRLMKGREAGVDNKDPRNWENFLGEAKAWAGNDYSRLRTYYGALWHHAQTTENWSSFWSGNEHVSIKPKHEVAPLPPTMWRFITERDLPSTLESLMKKGRNFGLELGHSISRVMQESARDLTYASYAVSPYTEILRQTSWRFAEHVKRADWDMLTRGLTSSQAAEVKKVYEAAANAHPEYHQVWDYAIDRNPQRTSTSYASRHRWGSYFHYGPYEQYRQRGTFRAAMSGSEYFTTALLAWPMWVVRKMNEVYTPALRSGQESISGGAGKWDTRESPLKRWEHTNPRLLEAVRTFLNPLAARLGQDTVYQNPAAHRDMAGKRLGGGLKVAPQDLNYVETGVYAEARTGAANPGVSHYNFRHSLVPATAAAEYLAYRAPHSAFFETDAYIKKYALVSTTKREVDSLAFALERERELRGFGASTNPIWSFFNVPFFVWHGGGGVMGSWSPKDVIPAAIRKFRDKGPRADTMDMAVAAAMSFGSNFERTRRRIFNPREEIYVTYCSQCNKPGYRMGSRMGGAGRCSSCHTALL